MKLAAIDLGSNSFRLEIANVYSDAIVSNGMWKKTLRLAAGIDSNGQLTDRTMESALDAIRFFSDQLEGFNREDIRCVGTQTLRAAKNSSEFTEEAQKILGCPVEIIKGKEEARLVYAGCSFALPPSNEKRLIIDVGGASTECVIGQAHQVLESESFHVGCVNTSVAFFRNGNFDRINFDRAELSASALFEGNLQGFKNEGWDRAYGSSGTVSAISLILKAAGQGDGRLTLSNLQWLKEQLIKTGNVKNMNFEGLREDRREVLAGGVAVLIAIFKKLGITDMRTAEGALRYGILYDLALRKTNSDPRRLSIDELVQKFRVDPLQSKRVSNLSMRFFRQLQSQRPTRMDQYLEWAGRIHEIGLTVSRSDYHKHGRYLIANCDIPGFSITEQQIMADLVLGHRGNLKKVEDKFKNKQFVDALFCLRMAARLCQERADEEWGTLGVTSTEHGYLFKAPKAWFNTHDLSVFVLNEERKTWSLAGYKLELSPL